MRKNTRNEKVLRAITIGLAAMIASTSMPVTALADDDFPTPTGSEGETSFGETNSGENTYVPESFTPVETPATDAFEVCETAEAIIADPSPFMESEANETSSASEETTTPPLSASEETNSADTTSIPEDIDAAIAAVVAVPSEENALSLADTPIEVTIPQVSLPDPTVGEGEPQPTTGEANVTVENTTVKGALEAAKTDIEETKKALEDAEDALRPIKEYETNVENASKQLDIAEYNFESFNENDENYKSESNSVHKTEDEANKAITYANSANDLTKTEEEALEAAGLAAEALGNAVENLDEATKVYGAAETAVNAARNEYNDAKEKYDEACENLEKANEAAAKATTNAAEAQARLAAAKAKVNEAAGEMGKYADDLEQLEEIRDQYYALMVFYSRMSKTITDENGEKKTYTNTAKYNEDGTLNVKESAEANKDNIDIFAKNNGDPNLVKMGRYLTRSLVEYVILNSDDVDSENPEFTFGAGGSDTIQAGTVYKNNKGQDQTYVGDGKTDNSGNYIPGGDKITGIKWNKPNSSKYENINGRSNYVIVTYKDKNGDTQTKKYNYVYKNSERGDETDLENGMFYLAEIGDKGEITRVVSDYNFDDYGKLVNTVNYLEAKKAVEKAEAEVERLNKELENLQKVSISQADLENLKTRLEAAESELEEKESDLKNAATKKKEIEDLVEEARTAVGNINTKRTAPEEEDEKEETQGEETQGEETQGEETGKEETVTTPEEKDEKEETGKEETVNTPEDNKPEEQPKQEEEKKEEEEEKKEEENLNPEEEQGETQEAEPVAEEVPEEKKEKKPTTPTTDTTDFTIPSGPSADTPSDEPSSDGTTATPDTTPEVTSSTTPAVIPGIIPEVTPGGTPVELDTIFGGGTGFGPIAGGSGVAGVNLSRAADISGLFEDSNEFSEKLAKAQDTVKQVKAAEKKGQKTVKIEDQEVPLAAMPTEDGIHISWLWLLIILLLGEMGREMYKKHKERMEAKAEANKTNE